MGLVRSKICSFHTCHTTKNNGNDSETRTHPQRNPQERPRSGQHVPYTQGGSSAQEQATSKRAVRVHQGRRKQQLTHSAPAKSTLFSPCVCASPDSSLSNSLNKAPQRRTTGAWGRPHKAWTAESAHASSCCSCTAKCVGSRGEDVARACGGGHSMLHVLNKGLNKNACSMYTRCCMYYCSWIKFPRSESGRGKAD